MRFFRAYTWTSGIQKLPDNHIEVDLVKPDVPPPKLGNRGNVTSLKRYWKKRDAKIKADIIATLKVWAGKRHAYLGGISTLWLWMDRPMSYRKLRKKVLELAKKKEIRLERFIYDPKGEYKPGTKKVFDIWEVILFSYDEPHGIYEFPVRWHWDEDRERDSKGRYV